MENTPEKKANAAAEELAKDIELVDIEDLRTAFGGEGVDTPDQKSAPYMSTRMCSGWRAE